MSRSNRLPAQLPRLLVERAVTAALEEDLGLAGDLTSQATLAPEAKATAIWLSLMRMASSSEKRWFAPPPQRTAYFWNALSPGVVLRVSQICAPVPATASAYSRVSVAMPLR